MKTFLLLALAATLSAQYTPPAGGGGGSGTVTEIKIQGTSNQTAVSGNCDVTTNNNASPCVVGFSATPVLPNGTTATTQSQADNSTKPATTAYTDTAAAAAGLNGICVLGNQNGTVTLNDSSCSGALTGTLPWGLVTMTANGAITLAAPTLNKGPHQINITQDGTGGRIVTFNAAFANVPQQVTVAGTLNWYAFFWTGTATVATSGGNTSGLTQCGTQAAPGSNPPSNTVYVHCDSTTGAPQSVDSSGNVKNYVKDLAATSSNFLTSIVNGVPTKAQPAFTDISGAATGAQLPATAVQTNQANTYSTGAQDYGSATSLKVPVGAGAAPATNGQIAYDSTAHMLHAAQSSADAKVPQFTVTPTNGDCVNWVVSGSQFKLGTLGSACGSASAAATFPVNPQTSTYQVLAADFTACKTITVASGTFTITLVASGSQPANGQCLWVINYGSGVVTIARSGQNINGGTSGLTLAAASATAPTGAWIVSDGTNYFASLSAAGGGSGVTSVGLTMPAQICAPTGTPVTTSGTLGCAYPALPNSYTMDVNSPYQQNQSIRRTSTILSLGGTALGTSPGENTTITGTLVADAPTSTSPNAVHIVLTTTAVGLISTLNHRSGRTHGISTECGVSITVTANVTRYIPCGFSSSVTFANSFNADVPTSVNSAYIIAASTGAYTSGTIANAYVICTIDASVQNCVNIGAGNMSTGFHHFRLFEDVTNNQWTGCVDGTCASSTTHLPVSGTNLAIFSGSIGAGGVSGNWAMTFMQTVDDLGF